LSNLISLFFPPSLELAAEYSAQTERNPKIRRAEKPISSALLSHMT